MPLSSPDFCAPAIRESPCTVLGAVEGGEVAAVALLPLSFWQWALRSAPSPSELPGPSPGRLLL